MIGRLIRVEAGSLRRSLVGWLAVLLVAGGSVVGRTLAWIAHALARSELAALLFINPGLGRSDVAIPLALLAYLILTTHAFGRDFEDGNIDLVLTAPVRREAVVIARMFVIAIAVLLLSFVGWGADVVVRSVLAASSFDPGPLATPVAMLGSAIAAIATLPVVAWASIRLRGVLPALGLGLAIQVAALALGAVAPVRSLPWYLPTTLAAGGSASWISVLLSVLLFTGGLAATIHGLHSVDLYE